MSNKEAKEKLIEMYGAECFIDKLHLYDGPVRKYTGKGQYAKMKMLSYHHIRMKCKGGKATVENGALLSVENHRWFHQQSKQKQKEMNDKFQAYKRNKYTPVEIKYADEEIIPIKIKMAQISISEELEVCAELLNVYEGMTEEEIAEYREHKQKRNKRVLDKFEEER